MSEYGPVMLLFALRWLYGVGGCRGNDDMRARSETSVANRTMWLQMGKQFDVVIGSMLEAMGNEKEIACRPVSRVRGAETIYDDTFGRYPGF